MLTLCAGQWARAQACHQNRKKRKSLGARVLKQEEEQQQISLSFRLEGLKESEMNAKCKQQHSLSAGTLLPA